MIEEFQAAINAQAILLGFSVVIALTAICLSTIIGRVAASIINIVAERIDRRVKHAKGMLYREAEIYAQLINKRLKRAGIRRGRIMYYVTPDEIWLCLDQNLTDENTAWLRNNVPELCMTCQREVRLFKSDFRYWLKIERGQMQELATP